MEKLCKVVVIFLVLLLHLDLGRCYYGARGTVGKDAGRPVARSIQTNSNQKVVQSPNKYGSRRFGSTAGRPYWGAYPWPAYRGWRTWGSFQGNGFAPQSFPPYGMRYPPLSAPVLPRPSAPKFSPPTSFPPSRSNPLPPNVRPPLPIAKPPTSPTRGVAVPSLPAPVQTRTASPLSPAVTGVASEAEHGAASRPISVFVTAGASFLLVISVALFVACYRSSKVVTVRPWATGLSGQLQKAFVTGVPALKRSELEIACEDFSNIIGSLSDYMMYKGTLSSGVEIAVVSTTAKSAKDWSENCEKQFRRKITSLSRVNHKNFVNLLGYCEEEQPFTRMMVFEYAPNGTLFEHLRVRDDHLDWPMRLRVAVGVAYCVDHMHQLNPPEILRTLDTSTIHLTDDYAAKVSDIFFCEEPKQTEIASLLPVLSDKESVVYNYGMILLEIITAKFTVSDGGLLESWTACYLRGERQLKDMVDLNLKSFHVETVDKLNNVIRSCTDREPRKRPTMSEVARQLREITSMSPDAATPKVSPLWWAELEIISTEAN